MPRPAKRVSFGSLTPLSASPIEDSEGIDLRDSSRLLDAPPSHTWMHGSPQVATVSAATPPLVHNAAGTSSGRKSRTNTRRSQPYSAAHGWKEPTHRCRLLGRRPMTPGWTIEEEAISRIQKRRHRRAGLPLAHLSVIEGPPTTTHTIRQWSES
ncbi:hypothetical protein LSCM4_01658 [Leishmania orientalis]|uniref:Uncharacterized protein n=1 Tax=Leishmania orientalis TaxID=2249476 RepID=A0A836KBT1_9TRYP|nr:hypothetical protein LSCM4_01658 [Leishmania orientalis]